MTTVRLRWQVKERVNKLPSELLPLADDFLAYLEDRKLNAATTELLKTPGLVDRVRKTKKQVASGKSVNWRKARSNV